MTRRVAFYTLGCKLNQCETAGIRAQFSGPGYTVVPFEAAADIYILNTCSVTGRADAQARQMVRRIVRQRPGSRVVVTGCYAQRAPRELAAIPGVALVAGNGEKDGLRRLVESLGGETVAGRPAAAPASARVEVGDLRKARRSFDMAPVEFGERTRAYLRVQDGCDAGCTFCIIPRLRGRSTSLDPALAVARVRRLVDEGFREIILTGIHLGLYGRDRSDGTTLASLVERIDDLPGDFRVRLSSIEPQEIDDRLIGRLAGGGRLVPHLHVPLQSGSDTVLGRMNRTYSAGDYRRVVERITARVDPLGLGADVIVGFPGETDAEFEETVRFIGALPFSYLHVFPFSPRAGTRAATLPGRPGPAVVEARSLRVRELGAARGRAFARRFVGRAVGALVEEPAGFQGWEGWSEHYVRVQFPWPNDEDVTNRLIAVDVEGAEGSRLFGRPAPVPAATLQGRSRS